MTDPRSHQAPVAATTFPCGGCGARLEFAPGSTGMQCPYCGFRQEIAAGDRRIREVAFSDLPALPRKPVGSIGAYVLVCQRCAARSETNETASVCQFCGAPLVIDPAASGQIVPEGVLPFGLDRGAVRDAMRTWTSSRWFAPTALKKVTETESMKSTYVPHWTYDSQTVSDYDGQRGEHYYVTESYTDGNGERRTRQVRRTRWHPARGTVSRAFDDVLVPGSTVLPTEKVDDLAPWPLDQAAPYQPEFLAGHFALRYDVEPEGGFTEARNRMAPVIAEDCRRDIGGDEQRVNAVDTRHSDVTFKLMLLPVWIASYIFAGRTWQILVNGRTGEVHGERPWSKAKIAIAVILAVIVLAAIAYFGFLRGGGSSHASASHATANHATATATATQRHW
jgi:DNA-directed RNA polymerase subunit RPC12/RpoP